MKNFLVETNYSKLEIIEEKSIGGKTVMRGPVGKVDVKNRNGRVYPREVMEREIPKLLAESNRTYRLGAVDHPTTGSSITDLAIKYTDMFIDNDNTVIAEMEIIPTHKGQDLEKLVRAGIEVGMSSRGAGETKYGKWKDGTEALIVGNDYDLVTFDAVVNPSVAEARVKQMENHQAVLERVDTLLEADPTVLDRIIEQLESSSEELVEDDWTTAYKNNLPDSAFLYIEPGGTKDKSGKTVPRSLRHLPYKNAAGDIDLPHLRNALARIPQSDFLSETQKKSLTAKATKLLNKTKKATEGLDIDTVDLNESAKWSQDYNEELPDDHFLYIPEDAESDSLGNKPKDQRFWPYIDAQGDIDADQLQKAIGEITDSQLPLPLKQMLVAHAQSIINSLVLTGADSAGTDIETMKSNVRDFTTSRTESKDEDNKLTVQNKLDEAATKEAKSGESDNSANTEQAVNENKTEETKVEENKTEETKAEESKDEKTGKDGANVVVEEYKETVAKLTNELNESKSNISNLTEENKKLKKSGKTIVESYASLSALLNALKTALIAELSDNDWDDASWLADFGEGAQWRMADDAVDALGVDDDDEDEAAENGPIGENIKNSIAVIESLQTFVPEFVGKVRDYRVSAYIAEKTKEDRFGRAIAAKLAESAPDSTKKVDELYESVAKQVEREMNNVPGTSVGTVGEDSKPKYTKEQIAQRRLVPGLEPLF